MDTVDTVDTVDIVDGMDMLDACPTRCASSHCMTDQNPRPLGS